MELSGFSLFGFVGLRLLVERADQRGFVDVALLHHDGAELLVGSLGFLLFEGALNLLGRDQAEVNQELAQRNTAVVFDQNLR